VLVNSSSFPVVVVSFTQMTVVRGFVLFGIYVFCTLLLVFWDCLVSLLRLLSASYRCFEDVEVATNIRNASTLLYRSTRRTHPTALEAASYKKHCQIKKPFSVTLLAFFSFAVA